MIEQRDRHALIICLLLFTTNSLFFLLWTFHNSPSNLVVATLGVAGSVVSAVFRLEIIRMKYHLQMFHKTGDPEWFNM